MGAISSKGRLAFRKYVTDGVPGSGVQNPAKADIFAAFDEIDSEVAGNAATVAVLNTQIGALAGIGAGGVAGFASLAALNANLNYAAGTLAIVSYASDPTHAGSYIKSGASGSGSWSAFGSTLDVLGPDIPVEVVVNLVGSDGGLGTAASPYSPNDLKAFITASEAAGNHRSIVVLVEGDHNRGSPWRFDATKWRSIEIRSVTGKTVDLMASRFLGTGGSAFTQPDAVNFPNVWMVDNFYAGVSASVAGSSCLIDIDATQPCGRSGATLSNYTLYTNIGDNIALATINSTTYRGCTSAQKTGIYAGKVLVHARGSLNPNTINFEQAIYDFCLLFTTSSGTAINACKVKLTGIRANFALQAGIWADRCEVDWDNCMSQFNIGYGFNPNQCWGRLLSCVAQFNQIDGFNANGGIADASALDRNVRLVLIGCKSLGNTQTVVPPVIAQPVGDGFSNHNSQTWECIDCHAIAATKDGFSMVDEFKLNNCIGEDCVTAGVTFASQSGKQLTARIFGGRMSSNNTGIQCNANGTTETATLDIYGTILDTNISESLLLSGNRTTAINAYDVKTLGATPSNGHKHDSSSAVSHAINVKTSSALV